MSYGRSINIAEFKKRLENQEPSLRQEYHSIFQSFAKRIEYCDIYFSGFNKVATPEAIAHDYDTDFCGVKEGENVLDYRLYYEAYALAFLQNVHALCDTVPYAVNRILLKDKSETWVKWDKNFVTGVTKRFPKDKEFTQVLSNFMKDEDFLKLKSYINKAKHQHLVFIRNTSSELIFSDFTYEKYNAKREKGIARSENVERFMLRVHEKLLSQLVYIYNYMYQLV